jgi:magnesium transporter
MIKLSWYFSLYIIEPNYFTMIEIYLRRAADEEMKIVDRLDDAEKGSWINLVCPNEIEINEISEKFKIPQDTLHDMLDMNERPLVDKEGEFTYAIIRIPFKDADESIITAPLGIIINEGYLITVCPCRNEILTDFLNGKIKNFYTTKKTRFLLQVFSRTNYYYMKYLNEIYKNIEKKESSLKKLKNEDIVFLVELEKTLLYFSTSVTPNSTVLEKILSGKIIKLFKGDEDILEDILIDTKQTIDMTNVYAKILRNVREAYSSIINNDLNKILKFLASVTVIMTIPMIMTSMYGMNIGLPFQQSEFAFVFVMGTILAISAALIYIFVKQDWL